jgi:DNA-binding NarL/FixJ family response regulator
MIRVLLVDDQPLFRQGLADLLALNEDLEIVGEANHGAEAIELTSALQPDVILMDIRMPVCDGVEATRQIHQTYPWIKIMVLTTFDEDEYIWQSLQAGALGYILKSTPSPQVANAIRTLYVGHSQLGPTIASKVFDRLQPPPVTNEQSLLPEGDGSIDARSEELRQRLNQRELEILQQMRSGRNNREIAELLHLSEGTIKNYITNLLSKLNLRDRTQAALWAEKQLSKQ